MKKYIIIFVAVVIIAPFLFIYREPVVRKVFDLLFFLPGGTYDIPQKDYPLLGTTFVISEPSINIQGETSWSSSPRYKEISRHLSCPYEDIYQRYFKNNNKDVTYIAKDTKFTVTEAFKVHSYGLITIDSGPGDYITLVLKDEKGSLTTISDYQTRPGKICMNTPPGYLNKLFEYIQKTGKAHISLALDDLSGNLDFKATQEETIKKLAINRVLLNENSTRPKQKFYNFLNIKKTPTSQVRGLAGIEMDVDADALAYLTSSQIELQIWKIIGLDEAFQKTLTDDERTQMLAAPCDKEGCF